MLMHMQTVLWLNTYTYLQALLDDIQQDEEAEEVHATHGNGPQQIRPEEAMFCAHSVVVPTCAARLSCHSNSAHTSCIIHPFTTDTCCPKGAVQL